VISLDSVKYPLARYYYAVSLRTMQQYGEAEKQFNYFLDEYKTEDGYTSATRKEILNLRFIQSQLTKKDLKRYSVIKMGAPLNTTGAGYAPVWVADNILLFTSTRPDSAAAKNQVFTNRIYQAVYTDSVNLSVSLSDLPQTAGHQGAVSFMPDGNTVFFTRWTLAEGKKTSAIYSSHKSSTGWSAPVPADSLVNAAFCNAQQPFVMADGKYLLYASDKPGGFGGFDIWKAELDSNGAIISSANLGATINTADDEQGPYYHAPTATLVFSTNGRIGMGGYDFFYSKDNAGAWSTPVNFGYPVNSVKDDIYFVSRGGAKSILDDVWLSSDRSADCCLELFELKKERPVKHVAGVVIDCRDNTPLVNVKLNITDTVSNTALYDRTSAADGTYSFTLDDYKPLKIVASANGYTADSVHFTAPPDVDEDTATVGICLTFYVPPVGKSMVIENVYFDFDKAILKDSSFASLDKIAGILTESPNMFIEISAHTDNKGKTNYNQRLSLARAKSVVAYFESKGINKDRLWSKGYGAAMPIAPNSNADGTDNPEGRRQNRRIEFKVLKN
jgi:outer membrane protein OmpA-like peptidoglycan-associated protein